VTALKLHDCRTISAQPPYGFASISPPRVRTKNRTIIVYYVDTYAVARTHIRCPKNSTENRRRSYRARGKCKLGLTTDAKIIRLISRRVAIFPTAAARQFFEGDSDAADLKNFSG